MNIIEATKLAMKTGGLMYRESEEMQYPQFIPTNVVGFIMRTHPTVDDKPYQYNYYERWQPNAKDILADDWGVIGINN
ncbi:Thoeris anti-defense Tad2 family protein [Staphylococcus xylosus]|uniref:Thoeris anti-defense Tad2 family protein n=1 Tax=Staphylococcus xylosus TaxID=1288 RepID=UPI000D1D1EA5|nr:MW1434 family type I TA system toxin [Staphylococcus xylosus]PTI64181.1 DUF2829 domain-containing protein [Staphylococcus xylosus]